jgi:hypothetical protein
LPDADGLCSGEPLVVQTGAPGGVRAIYIHRASRRRQWRRFPECCVCTAGPCAKRDRNSNRGCSTANDSCQCQAVVALCFSPHSRVLRHACAHTLASAVEQLSLCWPSQAEAALQIRVIPSLDVQTRTLCRHAAHESTGASVPAAITAFHIGRWGYCMHTV